MMIVDTPGMIDTPVHHSHSRTSIEGQQRGYDFLKATKWFASRADVILLMFDPANPGTTGETLDVMQQSLLGQEHKFLILLNKVDMFDRVTDFARCYGTLCWNLSKNIQKQRYSTNLHDVHVERGSAGEHLVGCPAGGAGPRAP
jgi:predicted GTPase